MDKTLRTAATGLAAQQRYVEIISHNIANANTTGYKTVRPEFQDLLYETLRPAGTISRNGTEPLNEVQIGSGVELVGTAKHHRQGDVQETGRELDMAIHGEGFFVVTLPDGNKAYTRDGTFSLNNVGEVVNSQGYRLDPWITIPDDAVEIQISKNGTINILRNFSIQPETVGQIELARFVNTGEILQKYLENSNVSIVTEMVNMITAQRAYELNSKSVQTADNVLGTAVNLKRQ